MTSVYYPTLKDGIGEMLYTICGSDGESLVFDVELGTNGVQARRSRLRLGTVMRLGFCIIGVLWHPHRDLAQEMTSTPLPVRPTRPSEIPTDIILGTREVPSGPPLADMSDEEKQREAERLFVLFERMERMGMAKNPIREAFHSGKFQGP